LQQNNRRSVSDDDISVAHRLIYSFHTRQGVSLCSPHWQTSRSWTNWPKDLSQRSNNIQRDSITIIRPLQSTARYRPLQILTISLDLRLLASSSCQPSCVNCHSTWPEGALHYVYLDAFSTSELPEPQRLSVLRLIIYDSYSD
jgi:hypothetical protein